MHNLLIHKKFSNKYSIRILRSDGSSAVNVVNAYYTRPTLNICSAKFSLANELFILDDAIVLERNTPVKSMDEYHYLFLSRRLAELPKLFKKKMIAIGRSLDEMYSVYPLEQDFIEWYNKYKLLPYIKLHTCIIWIAKLDIKGSRLIINQINSCAATSYPKLSNSDLQEYCLTIRKEMSDNDKLIRRLLNISEIPAKENDVIETYNWELSLIQLEALYVGLYTKNYIDCRFDSFKAIFGIGGSLEAVKPIKWLGKERSLIFLMELLRKNKCIKQDEPKVGKWVQMQSMFIKSNGENYNTDSLKNSFQHVYLPKPTKFQKPLNDLVSNMLFL